MGAAHSRESRRTAIVLTHQPSCTSDQWLRRVPARIVFAFGQGVLIWGKVRSTVYCEYCGLQILPQRPVCTRCGETPTRQWMQFISLIVLFLAILGNSLAGWLVLPRLIAAHPSRVFFRVWLWIDLNSSLYGWIPLAAALLAWEFLVWRKIRKNKPMPKIKGWISRKILTFVLAAGFAPVLPWWLPAGQPSDKTLATLARYPGLPCGISWCAVLLVAAVLCIKAETRDRLLGQGRLLSIVSLSALAALLALTLLGWSMT
jgi:hypothetical protein